MKLAILCFLIVLLLGCAGTKVVTETVEVRVPVVEYVPVPEALLSPCTVEVSIKTNADLELVLAEALLELKRCTADKEAIRELE